MNAAPCTAADRCRQAQFAETGATALRCVAVLGSARRPRGRRGFTLIEVLLATLLMGVLLGSVWSLLGMYSRGLDRNTQRTDQAQVVRAVLQRLSDDLTSALPVETLAVVPTGAPAAERHPGRLIGGRSSLSFDLWRAPERPASAALPPPSAGRREPADEAATGATAGLRSVTYALYDALRFRGDVAAAPAQVVARRESAWLDDQRPADRNAPPRAGSAPLANRVAPQPAEALGLAAPEPLEELYLNELREVSPAALKMLHPPDALGSAAAEPAPDEPQAQARQAGVGDAEPPADATVDLVPELDSLRFRYFDGRQWSRQWDSQQRRALPIAVEVTLRLRQAEEPLAQQAPDEARQSQREEPIPPEPPVGTASQPGQADLPRSGELRAVLLVAPGRPREADAALDSPSAAALSSPQEAPP